MQPRNERLLYWTPRTLAVLYAAWVIFTIVYHYSLPYSTQHDDPPTRTMGIGFLIFASIPALGALAIAWCWGWAGGLLMLGYGVWFLIGLFHDGWRYSPLLGITAPLIPLGVLFEIDWYCRRL
jgi:hypothetical protein